MKTQWILTAFFGLCLFASTAFASPANLPLPDETKVLVNSTATPDQNIQVQLANLQQRFTDVKLTTFRGDVLARKTINDHNGYRMAFDLSKLRDGRYFLRIQQGETTLTQVILIEDGNILFSAVK